MKSLPFSDPMMRALLREEGPKCMTRRTQGLDEINSRLSSDWKFARWDAKSAVFTRSLDGFEMPCVPRLKAGDAFYAKETWQWASLGGACGPADDYPVYRATDPDWSTMTGWRWRSPRFLPAANARLFLRVTEVRAERVAEISLTDSMNEGIRELPLQEGQPGAWWTADVSAGTALHGRTPRQAFKKLWASINGPESWERNPWVWVYSFARIAPALIEDARNRAVLKLNNRGTPEAVAKVWEEYVRLITP